MRTNKIVLLIIGFVIAFIFFVNFNTPRSVTVISVPSPTSVPFPTPYVFDEHELWSLVQDWQVSQGRKPYIESDILCDLAETRTYEIKSDFSHNGFWTHTSDFSYQILGENLARDFATEQETLDAWLASPSHRKNLTDYFMYSCLSCKQSYCVQIFANF